MSNEPYETANPADPNWTITAHKLQSQGDLHATVRRPKSGIEIAEVTGICPRCSDDPQFSQVRELPIADETFILKPRRPQRGATSDESAPKDDEVRAAEFVEVTVKCSCSGSHAGRPVTEIFGCGIYFTMNAERVPA